MNRKQMITSRTVKDHCARFTSLIADDQTTRALDDYYLK